jgi:gliding motility-associated-like protein
MRKFYTIFSIISALASTEYVNAQCTNDAYAKNGASNVKTITIDCGQTVKIGTIADPGMYVTAYENNFNTGVIGAGWVAPDGAIVITDSLCTFADDQGDGTRFLWFGNGTTAPRNIESVAYDVRRGGKIQFDMRFAREENCRGYVLGGKPQCEGPDLPAEGVRVQFSTDNGATWTDIPNSYKDPNSGCDDNLVVWKTWTYDIPIDALTTATKFRWYQSSSSDNNSDHWGLDNIKILLNDPRFKFEWSHLPNFNAATPPAVAPGTSTTYTVRYVDTVGNLCDVTSSVQVNVTNNNSVNSRAEVPVICPGDNTKMITISNLFAPDPNTCGITSTGPGCGTGYQASTVTVGTGTNVQGWNSGGTSLLGDFGSDDNRGQMLFLANEVKAGLPAGRNSALISSIALDVAVAGQTGTNSSSGSIVYPYLAVYIGCTNQNTLGSFVPMNTLVRVFEGTNVNVTPGWRTFNFNNPYSWDGTSNLVVQVCWYNTSDQQTTASKVRTTTIANRYIEANTNGGTSSTQTDVCNTATAFTTTSNERPNIRFGVCTATPTPNVRFEWTPAATLNNPNIFDPTATPTSTTTYTVRVYDISTPQCVVSDTAHVIVKPNPVATITGPTVRCVRDGLTLTAGTNPNLPGTTFTWTKNDTGIAGGATLNDNPAAGTHTYVVTPTLNGCTGTPATHVVTVNPDPVLPTVTPGVACNSEPATHNISNSAAYAGFGANIRYDWTGPGGFTQTTTAANVTRTPSVAGAYTVVARAQNTGCYSDTASFNVITNNSPADPVLSTNSPICPGTTLNLDATTTERANTYTNNGATIGNYTSRRTTYTYTYQWNGPGTINNGTTKNANSPAVGVGNYNYNFVYRETVTVVDSTCTIVAPPIGQPTKNCNANNITTSSVTCPSNVVTENVDVVALPTVTGRQATCVDTSAAAPNPDAYTVRFNVNGGVAPYTVTSVTPAAITGSFAGNTYTSNNIRYQDSTYSFTVRDSRNCPATTVSGKINCSVPQPPPCTMSIGSFPSTTTNQTVCGVSSSMSFVYDNTLDGGSGSPVTYFLIHDGSYTGATTNIIDVRSGSTTITINWDPAKYSMGVTYTITPVRSLADGTNPSRPDFTYSCLDIAPGRTFKFNPLPSATLTAAPTQVCNGGSSKLGLNFTGIGPFDVTINNGSGNTNYLNVTFGDTIPVSPVVNTTYTITSVTDKSTTPACSSTSGLGSATVSLAGSPVLGSSVPYECNANNDAYKVRFGITQGDEGTYNITQNDGITTVSGNYNSALDTFYSAEWIPSGTAFTYKVTDGNNCNPKILTRTFACACATNAGTMSLTSVSLCPSEKTVASIHNGDQILDGNDVLMFVLHQGSGSSIVSPVDTSNTPVFGYDPDKMAFNRDYYITPIAGNAKAGFPSIVDDNDPCRSIKPGFKVVWKEGPLASVVLTDNRLCVGDTTMLNINIVGNNPPYTLVYSNGVNDIVVTSNTAVTQYQVNNVQKDSTYVLKSVSDAQCSGLLAVDTAALEVYNYDNANFDYLVKNLCIDGGSVSNVTTLPGTSGGFYTANSSDINVSQSNGLVNPSLSKPGSYTITYRTNGFCPDTHSVNFVIVDSLRTPVFTYNNGGVYCDNEITGIRTFTNPGTPSNGTYTYTRVAPTPSTSTINLNPNGNLDIVNSDPGQYNVTYKITSTQGCLDKQYTFPVRINPSPDATFGYSMASACLDGGIDPVLEAPVSAGGTYTVSPASGLAFNNGNIIVGSSVPNTYTITYYATNNQCKDTFATNFTVLNALPIPEFNYAKEGFCQGEPNQPISFIDGSIPTNGTWTYTRVAPTPNNAALSFNPTTGMVMPGGSSPGVYEINYLIKKPGCADKSFAQNIFIYEQPRAKVLIGRDNCVGRIVDVNYTGTAPLGSNYQWFMGNNSEPKNYAGAGPHKVVWTKPGIDSVRVTVTSLDNCIDISTYQKVSILERARIDSIFASEPFPIKLYAREGKVVQFFSSVTGVTDYYWELGDGTFSSNPSPVHEYKEIGEYLVKLTVSNNSICFDTLSKGMIRVEDNGGMVVANAFSPNKDGTNDFFKPDVFGIQYYNIQIYNRWGQLVYAADELDTEGWDGTFDGKEVADGVYPFVLQGKTYTGEYVKKVGHVTVTR